jgi:hypothetical protein
MDAGVAGTWEGKIWRRLGPLLAIPILGLAALQSASAAESVYTDVDLDHCKVLSSPAEGEPGDFITQRCAGYGDFPLYFSEDDLRQSVYFGPIAKTILDQAGETFSAFNHIGKKVEWRVDDDGAPYAAILRWYIENANPDTGATDRAAQGQVLVVSKVAQTAEPVACVIGYVDALANPDANGLARSLADSLAKSFACGRDRPVFHAVKGDKSGEAVYRFPEL